MRYPGHLSVREAREIYFSNSGFDTSTYTDRWVKLPVLGKNLYLPNIAARRKAVPFHDIDHILTDYNTDWLGEFEISAYEIGTGCGRYWAAWMINMQGIVGGAILAPRRCIDAFARGRRSKGVYDFNSVQPLLEENLGRLRSRTTSAPLRGTPLDVVLFYSWIFASLALHIIPIVALIYALKKLQG